MLHVFTKCVRRSLTTDTRQVVGILGASQEFRKWPFHGAHLNLFPPRPAISRPRKQVGFPLSPVRDGAGLPPNRRCRHVHPAVIPLVRTGHNKDRAVIPSARNGRNKSMMATARGRTGPNKHVMAIAGPRNGRNEPVMASARARAGHNKLVMGIAWTRNGHNARFLPFLVLEGVQNAIIFKLTDVEDVGASVGRDSVEPSTPS
jgi:hypothetical protein